jgi:hypothetical protein
VTITIPDLWAVLPWVALAGAAVYAVWPSIRRTPVTVAAKPAPAKRPAKKTTARKRGA